MDNLFAITAEKNGYPKYVDLDGNLSDDINFENQIFETREEAEKFVKSQNWDWARVEEIKA